MRLSLHPKRSFPRWRNVDREKIRAEKRSGSGENPLMGHELQNYIDYSIVGSRVRAIEDICQKARVLADGVVLGTTGALVPSSLRASGGELTLPEVEWLGVQNRRIIFAEGDEVVANYPEGIKQLRGARYSLSDFFRLVWRPSDQEKAVSDPRA